MFHPVPGQDVPPSQGEALRASPDHLSSPSPTQANPLLPAQQKTPRGGERQPQPAQETDTEATADGKESLDDQRRAEGERCGAAEERGGKDGQAAGERRADEGLDLSRGSQGRAEEEEEEERKEPADANNNSMETPQNRQENFITIPEITEHVSVETGA